MNKQNKTAEEFDSPQNLTNIEDLVKEEKQTIPNLEIQNGMSDLPLMWRIGIAAGVLIIGLILVFIK